MKHLMKRGFALLMALVMVLGLLPAMSFAASAESSIVDYQYVDVNSTYTGVIKNWGTRGEPATFLSPNAEAFYAETSLEDLSALAGSADTDTVYTSALYAKLQKLMADAQTKTTSYDATRDLFQYTDIQKNGAESVKISAFYSGTAIGPAWDGGTTWNREHTWPNSKGGSGTHENDIMMLRPESMNINSSRNNNAYGVSAGFFDPNIASYDLHGDVARIMLYTYVRWGNADSAVLENMWGSEGVIESLDVLLDWVEEDPVDTWEMARNDSVESITGTRNVFVDYPELVFELFNAEIPEGYDTPSGSANSANVTIHVDNENPQFGEVIVNGEHVTVLPYAGYAIETVTFSDGVSYSQKDNVYTVTSDGECSVSVKFSESVSYTVTLVENGSAVSTASVVSGSGYMLPTFSGTVPEGCAFYGWTTADVGDVSAKPEIYAAGDEATIGQNTTFHAVLTYLDANDQSNPEKSWEQVDSAEDIAIGSSYVIAAKDYDFAMGAPSANGTYREQVAVTKSNTTLTFEPAAGVAELTLQDGIEIEVTEPVVTDSYVYTKITTVDELVDGDYLIVYETGSVIFDGSLTKLDVADNNQSVTITENRITAEEKYQFTIAAVDGGYSIKSASGYYIGRNTDKNGMLSNTSTQYVNTIAFNDDGSAQITGSKGAVLRFNSGTNSGMRFRYYTSATYTKQNAIHLYKRTSAAATVAVVAEETATATTTIRTYAFYDAVNSGYLSASSSADNDMKNSATLDENGSFTVSINTDGSCSLVAQGSYANNTVQYNKQSTRFSCYDGSTMQAIVLYVGTEGGGTRYYTTIWGARACAHTNTTTSTVEATCIVPGSVTVTCTDCGEIIDQQEFYADHTEVADAAVAPTLTNSGLTAGSHCSVCNEPIVEQTVIPAQAAVENWSLTLGSDLCVNFRFAISAEISSKAQVSITVAGGDPVVCEMKDWSFDCYSDDGTVEYYIASVHVAAAQMQDEIKVQILNGEDATEVKTYTVEGYAREVLANADMSQYHQVLKDMLNYGAAAQVYFNHNSEGTLPNAGIEGFGNAAIPTVVPTQQLTSGAVDGISFYAASLVHKERLAVRLYFKVTSGSIEDYVFTDVMPGQDAETEVHNLEPVQKGDYYYIEFADICPHQWANPVWVFVTANNQTLKVEYTPLDYIIRMNNKETGSDALKNMLLAMYNYHLAAYKLGSSI